MMIDKQQTQNYFLKNLNYKRKLKRTERNNEIKKIKKEFCLIRKNIYYKFPLTFNQFI